MLCKNITFCVKKFDLCGGQSWFWLMLPTISRAISQTTTTYFVKRSMIDNQFLIFCESNKCSPPWRDFLKQWNVDEWNWWFYCYSSKRNFNWDSLSSLLLSRTIKHPFVHSQTYYPQWRTQRNIWETSLHENMEFEVYETSETDETYETDNAYDDMYSKGSKSKAFKSEVNEYS